MKDSMMFTLIWISFMNSCTDCYGFQQKKAEEVVRDMVKYECRTR